MDFFVLLSVALITIIHLIENKEIKKIAKAAGKVDS